MSFKKRDRFFTGTAKVLYSKKSNDLSLFSLSRRKASVGITSLKCNGGY